MIRLALKKMFNSKLLIFSLFIGVFVAVLISSTIPIYSSSISHRMLVTQLENYQNEHDVSPGVNVISCSLASFAQKDNLENFKYCTNYLENNLYPNLNMPPLVKSITLSTREFKASDIRDIERKTVCKAVLKAVNSYENSIQIISGREPENLLDADGCVEVMISRTTQSVCKFSIGTIVKIGNTTNDVTSENAKEIVLLKVVGIFDYVSEPYNKIANKEKGEEFYCNYDYFYENIFIKENLVNSATWYFAGDYTKFDINKIEKTISTIENLNNNLVIWGISGGDNVTPPIEQYKTYYENISSINVLLILFYSPILILVIFFIFMVSKFIVEKDKNEISMLNSRGASRVQILLMYLIQGGAIALISVILSPLCSFVICKILGTTSGFLEFSQRAPLKIDISFNSLLFSIIAAFLSIITMLIPVFKSSKIEIVQQKRKENNPLFSYILLTSLAIISTIIAFYSYYVLVLQKEGLFTNSGSIQPLAYLFLICFFTAVSLTFVLLYPFVLKFILKIRQHKWTPEKFSAFSRIARLENREKFIVIFLTLTISIGIFSSISARTLNKNIDTSTDYKYPCDVIADVKYWGDSEKKYLFDDIDGVDATKVIIGNSPRINVPELNTYLDKNVNLMGVTPNEFDELIKWDDTILPNSMSFYMQKFEKEVNSCIISKNLSNALGVYAGDTIAVRFDTSLSAEKVVIAKIIEVVDAWPTYYPTFIDDNGEKQHNYLIVLNNKAIERVSQNQNYSVWMNTEKSINELSMMTVKLGSDKNASVRLENIVNGAREHRLSEINATRQSTNGALTLGFVSIIFVCAVGVVIYWIVSIKSRVMQIGTMRALGMSFNEIYRMILWEEILLCSVSIIVGIISGVASGFMFSPLLQSAFSEMGQMPPYIISMDIMDIIKLLVIISLLIALSVFVCISTLKQIKSTTSIKLGEE